MYQWTKNLCKLNTTAINPTIMKHYCANPWG